MKQSERTPYGECSWWERTTYARIGLLIRWARTVLPPDASVLFYCPTLSNTRTKQRPLWTLNQVPALPRPCSRVLMTFAPAGQRLYVNHLTKLIVYLVFTCPLWQSAVVYGVRSSHNESCPSEFSLSITWLYLIKLSGETPPLSLSGCDANSPRVPLLRVLLPANTYLRSFFGHTKYSRKAIKRNKCEASNFDIFMFSNKVHLLNSKLSRLVS